MSAIRPAMAVAACFAILTPLPALADEAEAYAGNGPEHAVIEAEVLAAAKAVYDPFQVAYPEEAAWQMPVYAHELKSLIDKWEAGLADGELENLNSLDWLCECQDLDSRRFRSEFTVRPLRQGSMAGVDVRLNLGWDEGEMQESRLFMVKENGHWKVADIISESFPVGLMRELQWAIEDHEAGQ